MAYPIIKIDPEWVVEQEQLGTKDKYWVRIENHELLKDNLWLLKFPKEIREGEDTGMHWSEKVAYELTRVLKILSPVVELATLDGRIASLTENFANAGYKLYHGNQVLANAGPNYDLEKIYGQNDHKITTIMSSIGKIFREEQAGEKAKYSFAQYLIFDALICNVDRHHENWGILRKKQPDETLKGRLAPSYDHASSMGRELVDIDPNNPNKKSRSSLLKAPAGITRYIEAGRGPIFVDGTGRKGPSPMKLITRCLDTPEITNYFQKGLECIHYLEEPKIHDIINQVPAQHMSEQSKDFAKSLLCATLEQLDELRKAYP